MTSPHLLSIIAALKARKLNAPTSPEAENKLSETDPENKLSDRREPSNDTLSQSNIITSQNPDTSNIQNREKPEFHTIINENVIDNLVPPVRRTLHSIDKYGNVISLNEKQMSAVTLARDHRSFVLVGAAGTGKTTTMREVVSALVTEPEFPRISSDHKYLPNDTPGIVICAYTRRAVNNIRRSLSADISSNCITIHKLLEYAPRYYEEVDHSSGRTVNKMSFEPSRSSSKPLPSSIRVIIYEESSMIGTDLYNEIQDALLHPVVEIFLGDLQQLPPIFGPAILGFKLELLPVIELTEVYRQALESPIIRFLHRILSGKPILASEFPAINEESKNLLTIKAWKKKLSEDLGLRTAIHFFIENEKNGSYNPDEDVILCPHNKSFGTIELNKGIANHLARKRGAITHEVVAGFSRHYFSVGDKVLYEKEDAIIIDIFPNRAYTGADYKPASRHLSYHGVMLEKDDTIDTAHSLEDIDFMLSQAANNEDRVHQASHVIRVKLLDSEIEISIDKAKEVNSLALGYAISVHKAQGSEWNRVFLVLHQSHVKMIQRELLYTAISRAKEFVYIICEPECFVKGIESQRIKGNTLAEKAIYFRGRYGAEDDNGGGK